MLVPLRMPTSSANTMSPAPTMRTQFGEPVPIRVLIGPAATTSARPPPTDVHGIEPERVAHPLGRACEWACSASTTAPSCWRVEVMNARCPADGVDSMTREVMFGPADESVP